MAISIYVNPASLTAAQYDDIGGRLDAAGAGKPAGRLYHACFGSGDKLQVFEIWESQQASDKFRETLMPILQRRESPVQQSRQRATRLRERRDAVDTNWPSGT